MVLCDGKFYLYELKFVKLYKYVSMCECVGLMNYMEKLE